jgi:vitamin B12 transporter
LPALARASAVFLRGLFPWLNLKAQTSPVTPAASPALSGETVVTATRTPTRADALVSDVVVVDRAAIEASTARTLPELLARTAGLQFTANGGLPARTPGVFIRGTEARHTIAC